MFAHGVLTTVAAPSTAMPNAPTLAHKQALKQTIRFLKGLRNGMYKGLIFDAATPLFPVFYKDANFTRELHGKAHGAHARSRSAYVGMMKGATICATSRR